jgi:hypothetical protein
MKRFFSGTVGLFLVTASIAGDHISFTADFSDAARLAKDWTLDGNATWALRNSLLVLEKAGVPSGAIRRPSALAILQSVPLADVTLDVDLRSTAPLPDTTPRRDVLLVGGYQSSTRFYYVHISATRDAVHNGIFLVADADRRRIDTRSERAVLKDNAWHHARLVRKVATGLLEVYIDSERDPIMTATDTTLSWGRVGVGSFDDTAEFRSVHLTATTVASSPRH